MRQLPGVKQHLATRCFLGLGLAGFIAAMATACGPEATSDNASPGPTAPTTGGESQVPAKSPSPAAVEQTLPSPSPSAARAVPEEGRLGARPSANAQPSGDAQPGMHQLGTGGERGSLLYIPAGYRHYRPAPVILLLHGAGGDAQGGISLLRGEADAANLILLATSSRDRTWDIIVGEYGPDVSNIDQALADTFSRYAVDPTHVAVGGFSDGASYALSLGITNGDLFTHIISFSPGFMAPAGQEGKPRIFNSHGTGDQVLPIDRCSRRIVPRLKREGYDVTYREFDGPHTVPLEIAREAVAWFTGVSP
jgi:phospholipase/carboxylesterase